MAATQSNRHPPLPDKKRKQTFDRVLNKLVKHACNECSTTAPESKVQYYRLIDQLSEMTAVPPKTLYSMCRQFTSGSGRNLADIIASAERSHNQHSTTSGFNLKRPSIQHVGLQKSATAVPRNIPDVDTKEELERILGKLAWHAYHECRPDVCGTGSGQAEKQHCALIKELSSTTGVSRDALQTICSHYAMPSSTDKDDSRPDISAEVKESGSDVGTQPSNAEVAAPDPGLEHERTTRDLVERSEVTTSTVFALIEDFKALSDELDDRLQATKVSVDFMSNNTVKVAKRLLERINFLSLDTAAGYGSILNNIGDFAERVGAIREQVVFSQRLAEKRLHELDGIRRECKVNTSQLATKTKSKLSGLSKQAGLVSGRVQHLCESDNVKGGHFSKRIEKVGAAIEKIVKDTKDINVFVIEKQEKIVADLDEVKRFCYSIGRELNKRLSMNEINLNEIEKEFKMTLIQIDTVRTLDADSLPKVFGNIKQDLMNELRVIDGCITNTSTNAKMLVREVKERIQILTTYSNKIVPQSNLVAEKLARKAKFLRGDIEKSFGKRDPNFLNLLNKSKKIEETINGLYAECTPQAESIVQRIRAKAADIELITPKVDERSRQLRAETQITKDLIGEFQWKDDSENIVEIAQRSKRLFEKLQHLEEIAKSFKDDVAERIAPVGIELDRMFEDSDEIVVSVADKTRDLSEAISGLFKDYISAVKESCRGGVGDDDKIFNLLLTDFDRRLTSIGEDLKTLCISAKPKVEDLLKRYTDCISRLDRGKQSIMHRCKEVFSRYTNLNKESSKLENKNDPIVTELLKNITDTCTEVKAVFDKSKLDCAQLIKRGQATKLDIINLHKSFNGQASSVVGELGSARENVTRKVTASDNFDFTSDAIRDECDHVADHYKRLLKKLLDGEAEIGFCINAVSTDFDFLSEKVVEKIGFFTKDLDKLQIRYKAISDSETEGKFKEQLDTKTVELEHKLADLAAKHYEKEQREKDEKERQRRESMKRLKEADKGFMSLMEETISTLDEIPDASAVDEVDRENEIELDITEETRSGEELSKRDKERQLADRRKKEKLQRRRISESTAKTRTLVNAMVDRTKSEVNGLLERVPKIKKDLDTTADGLKTTVKNLSRKVKAAQKEVTRTSLTSKTGERNVSREIFHLDKKVDQLLAEGKPFLEGVQKKLKTANTELLNLAHSVKSNSEDVLDQLEDANEWGRGSVDASNTSHEDVVQRKLNQIFERSKEFATEVSSKSEVLLLDIDTICSEADAISKNYSDNINDAAEKLNTIIEYHEKFVKSRQEEEEIAERGRIRAEAQAIIAKNAEKKLIAERDAAQAAAQNCRKLADSMLSQENAVFKDLLNSENKLQELLETTLQKSTTMKTHLQERAEGVADDIHGCPRRSTFLEEQNLKSPEEVTKDIKKVYADFKDEIMKLKERKGELKSNIQGQSNKFNDNALVLVRQSKALVLDKLMTSGPSTSLTPVDDETTQQKADKINARCQDVLKDLTEKSKEITSAIKEIIQDVTLSSNRFSERTRKINGDLDKLMQICREIPDSPLEKGEVPRHTSTLALIEQFETKDVKDMDRASIKRESKLIVDTLADESKQILDKLIGEACRVKEGLGTLKEESMALEQDLSQKAKILQKDIDNVDPGLMPVEQRSSENLRTKIDHLNELAITDVAKMVNKSDEVNADIDSMTRDIKLRAEVLNQQFDNVSRSLERLDERDDHITQFVTNVLDQSKAIALEFDQMTSDAYCNIDQLNKNSEALAKDINADTKAINREMEGIVQTFASTIGGGTKKRHRNTLNLIDSLKSKQRDRGIITKESERLVESLKSESVAVIEDLALKCNEVEQIVNSHAKQSRELVDGLTQMSRTLQTEIQKNHQNSATDKYLDISKNIYDHIRSMKRKIDNGLESIRERVDDAKTDIQKTSLQGKSRADKISRNARDVTENIKDAANDPQSKDEDFEQFQHQFDAIVENCHGLVKDLSSKADNMRSEIYNLKLDCDVLLNNLSQESESVQKEINEAIRGFHAAVISRPETRHRNTVALIEQLKLSAKTKDTGLLKHQSEQIIETLQSESKQMFAELAMKTTRISQELGNITRGIRATTNDLGQKAKILQFDIETKADWSTANQHIQRAKGVVAKVESLHDDVKVEATRLANEANSNIKSTLEDYTNDTNEFVRNAKSTIERFHKASMDPETKACEIEELHQLLENVISDSEDFVDGLGSKANEIHFDIFKLGLDSEVLAKKFDLKSVSVINEIDDLTRQHHDSQVPEPETRHRNSLTLIQKLKQESKKRDIGFVAKKSKLLVDSLQAETRTIVQELTEKNDKVKHKLGKIMGETAAKTTDVGLRAKNLHDTITIGSFAKDNLDRLSNMFAKVEKLHGEINSTGNRLIQQSNETDESVDNILSDYVFGTNEFIQSIKDATGGIERASDDPKYPVDDINKLHQELEDIFEKSENLVKELASRANVEHFSIYQVELDLDALAENVNVQTESLAREIDAIMLDYHKSTVPTPENRHRNTLTMIEKLKTNNKKRIRKGVVKEAKLLAETLQSEAKTIINELEQKSDKANQNCGKIDVLEKTAVHLKQKAKKVHSDVEKISTTSTGQKQFEKARDSVIKVENINEAMKLAKTKLNEKSGDVDKNIAQISQEYADGAKELAQKAKMATHKIERASVDSTVTPEEFDELHQHLEVIIENSESLMKDLGTRANDLHLGILKIDLDSDTLTKTFDAQLTAAKNELDDIMEDHNTEIVQRSDDRQRSTLELIKNFRNNSKDKDSESLASESKLIVDTLLSEAKGVIGELSQKCTSAKKGLDNAVSDSRRSTRLLDIKVKKVQFDIEKAPRTSIPVEQLVRAKELVEKVAVIQKDTDSEAKALSNKTSDINTSIQGISQEYTETAKDLLQHATKAVDELKMAKADPKSTPEDIENLHKHIGEIMDKSESVLKTLGEKANAVHLDLYKLEVDAEALANNVDSQSDSVKSGLDSVMQDYHKATVPRVEECHRKTLGLVQKLSNESKKRDPAAMAADSRKLAASFTTESKELTGALKRKGKNMKKGVEMMFGKSRTNSNDLWKKVQKLNQNLGSISEGPEKDDSLKKTAEVAAIIEKQHEDSNRTIEHLNKKANDIGESIDTISSKYTARGHSLVQKAKYVADNITQKAADPTATEDVLDKLHMDFQTIINSLPTLVNEFNGESQDAHYQMYKLELDSKALTHGISEDNSHVESAIGDIIQGKDPVVVGLMPKQQRDTMKLIENLSQEPENNDRDTLVKNLNLLLENMNAKTSVITQRLTEKSEKLDLSLKDVTAVTRSLVKEFAVKADVLFQNASSLPDVSTRQTVVGNSEHIKKKLSKLHEHLDSKLNTLSGKISTLRARTQEILQNHKTNMETVTQKVLHLTDPETVTKDQAKELAEIEKSSKVIIKDICDKSNAIHFNFFDSEVELDGLGESIEHQVGDLNDELSKVLHEYQTALDSVTEGKPRSNSFALFEALEKMEEEDAPSVARKSVELAETINEECSEILDDLEAAQQSAKHKVECMIDESKSFVEEVIATTTHFIPDKENSEVPSSDKDFPANLDKIYEKANENLQQLDHDADDLKSNIDRMSLVFQRRTSELAKKANAVADYAKRMSTDKDISDEEQIELQKRFQDIVRQSQAIMEDLRKASGETKYDALKIELDSEALGKCFVQQTSEIEDAAFKEEEEIKYIEGEKNKEKTLLKREADSAKLLLDSVSNKSRSLTSELSDEVRLLSEHLQKVMDDGNTIVQSLKEKKIQLQTTIDDVVPLLDVQKSDVTELVIDSKEVKQEIEHLITSIRTENGGLKNREQSCKSSIRDVSQRTEKRLQELTGSFEKATEQFENITDEIVPPKQLGMEFDDISTQTKLLLREVTEESEKISSVVKELYDHSDNSMRGLVEHSETIRERLTKLNLDCRQLEKTQETKDKEKTSHEIRKKFRKKVQALIQKLKVVKTFEEIHDKAKLLEECKGLVSNMLKESNNMIDALLVKEKKVGNQIQLFQQRVDVRHEEIKSNLDEFLDEVSHSFPEFTDSEHVKKATALNDRLEDIAVENNRTLNDLVLRLDILRGAINEFSETSNVNGEDLDKRVNLFSDNIKGECLSNVRQQFEQLATASKDFAAKVAEGHKSLSGDAEILLEGIDVVAKSFSKEMNEVSADQENAGLRFHNALREFRRQSRTSAGHRRPSMWTAAELIEKIVEHSKDIALNKEILTKESKLLGELIGKESKVLVKKLIHQKESVAKDLDKTVTDSRAVVTELTEKALAVHKTVEKVPEIPFAMTYAEELKTVDDKISLMAKDTKETVIELQDKSGITGEHIRGLSRDRRRRTDDIFAIAKHVTDDLRHASIDSETKPELAKKLQLSLENVVEESKAFIEDIEDKTHIETVCVEKLADDSTTFAKGFHDKTQDARFELEKVRKIFEAIPKENIVGKSRSVVAVAVVEKLARAARKDLADKSNAAQEANMLVDFVVKESKLALEELLSLSAHVKDDLEHITLETKTTTDALTTKVEWIGDKISCAPDTGAMATTLVKIKDVEEEIHDTFTEATSSVDNLIGKADSAKALIDKLSEELKERIEALGQEAAQIIEEVRRASLDSSATPEHIRETRMKLDSVVKRSRSLMRDVTEKTGVISGRMKKISNRSETLATIVHKKTKQLASEIDVITEDVRMTEQKQKPETNIIIEDDSTATTAEEDQVAAPSEVIQIDENNQTSQKNLGDAVQLRNLAQKKAEETQKLLKNLTTQDKDLNNTRGTSSDLISEASAKLVRLQKDIENVKIESSGYFEVLIREAAKVADDAENSLAESRNQLGYFNGRIKDASEEVKKLSSELQTRLDTCFQEIGVVSRGTDRGLEYYLSHREELDSLLQRANNVLTMSTALLKDSTEMINASKWDIDGIIEDSQEIEQRVPLKIKAVIEKLEETKTQIKTHSSAANTDQGVEPDETVHLIDKGIGEDKECQMTQDTSDQATSTTLLKGTPPDSNKDIKPKEQTFESEVSPELSAKETQPLAVETKQETLKHDEDVKETADETKGIDDEKTCEFEISPDVSSKEIQLSAVGTKHETLKRDEDVKVTADETKGIDDEKTCEFEISPDVSSKEIQLSAVGTKHETLKRDEDVKVTADETKGIDMEETTEFEMSPDLSSKETQPSAVGTKHKTQKQDEDVGVTADEKTGIDVKETCEFEMSPDLSSKETKPSAVGTKHETLRRDEDVKVTADETNVVDMEPAIALSEHKGGFKKSDDKIIDKDKDHGLDSDEHGEGEEDEHAIRYTVDDPERPDYIISSVIKEEDDTVEKEEQHMLDRMDKTKYSALKGKTSKTAQQRSEQLQGPSRPPSILFQGKTLYEPEEKSDKVNVQTTLQIRNAVSEDKGGTTTLSYMELAERLKRGYKSATNQTTDQKESTQEDTPDTKKAKVTSKDVLSALKKASSSADVLAEKHGSPAVSQSSVTSQELLRRAQDLKRKRTSSISLQSDKPSQAVLEEEKMKSKVRKIKKGWSSSSSLKAEQLSPVSLSASLAKLGGEMSQPEERSIAKEMLRKMKEIRKGRSSSTSMRSDQLSPESRSVSFVKLEDKHSKPERKPVSSHDILRRLNELKGICTSPTSQVSPPKSPAKVEKKMPKSLRRSITSQDIITKMRTMKGTGTSSSEDMAGRRGRTRSHGLSKSFCHIPVDKANFEISHSATGIFDGVHPSPTGRFDDVLSKTTGLFDDVLSNKSSIDDILSDNSSIHRPRKTESKAPRKKKDSYLSRKGESRTEVMTRDKLVPVKIPYSSTRIMQQIDDARLRRYNSALLGSTSTIKSKQQLTDQKPEPPKGPPDASPEVIQAYVKQVGQFEFANDQSRIRPRKVIRTHSRPRKLSVPSSPKASRLKDRSGSKPNLKLEPMVPVKRFFNVPQRATVYEDVYPDGTPRRKTTARMSPRQARPPKPPPPRPAQQRPAPTRPTPPRTYVATPRSEKVKTKASLDAGKPVRKSPVRKGTRKGTSPKKKPDESEPPTTEVQPKLDKFQGTKGRYVPGVMEPMFDTTKVYKRLFESKVSEAMEYVSKHRVTEAPEGAIEKPEMSVSGVKDKFAAIKSSPGYSVKSKGGPYVTFTPGLTGFYRGPHIPELRFSGLPVVHAVSSPYWNEERPFEMKSEPFMRTPVVEQKHGDRKIQTETVAHPDSKTKYVVSYKDKMTGEGSKYVVTYDLKSTDKNASETVSTKEVFPKEQIVEPDHFSAVDSVRKSTEVEQRTKGILDHLVLRHTNERGLEETKQKDTSAGMRTITEQRTQTKVSKDRKTLKVGVRVFGGQDIQKPNAMFSKYVVTVEDLAHSPRDEEAVIIDRSSVTVPGASWRVDNVPKSAPPTARRKRELLTKSAKAHKSDSKKQLKRPRYLFRDLDCDNESSSPRLGSPRSIITKTSVPLPRVAIEFDSGIDYSPLIPRKQAREMLMKSPTAQRKVKEITIQDSPPNHNDSQHVPQMPDFGSIGVKKTYVTPSKAGEKYRPPQTRQNIIAPIAGAVEHSNQAQLESHSKFKEKRPPTAWNFQLSNGKSGFKMLQIEDDENKAKSWGELETSNDKRSPCVTSDNRIGLRTNHQFPRPILESGQKTHTGQPKVYINLQDSTTQTDWREVTRTKTVVIDRGESTTKLRPSLDNQLKHSWTQTEQPICDAECIFRSEATTGVGGVPIEFPHVTGVHQSFSDRSDGVPKVSCFGLKKKPTKGAPLKSVKHDGKSGDPEKVDTDVTPKPPDSTKGESKRNRFAELKKKFKR